jgi:hypothetical protein
VVSTTVLLLPEFPQISLRMTRWSCRSTTFSDSFVHHVRGPYSAPTPPVAVTPATALPATPHEQRRLIAFTP